jgi:hypothetical protein
MVKGKQDVAETVDKNVPEGPVNDAATNVISAALATGDVTHAQAVLDVAKSGPKSKVGPNLTWEDILDDKAWQGKLKADMDHQGMAGSIGASREQRIAASADANKGSLRTAQQAVSDLPLPEGTMEANKMLGYEGRRTIAEATEAPKSAELPEDLTSPWGRATQLFIEQNAKSKPRPSR